MGGISVPTLSAQAAAIGHKGVRAEAPPTNSGPSSHGLPLRYAARSAGARFAGAANERR
ncbi:DUF6053 domain-containing protein [Lysobacter enzymogenes]|uniref:DUF6053 domain-containing protein n=1 Tax=Lysobacter enzymogenes TaxID=69 RepID=UPI003CCD311E